MASLDYCGCGCLQQLPPRPRYLRGHDPAANTYEVCERGYKTPCWIATGVTSGNNGYGIRHVEWNGKRSVRMGSHRLAYIHAKGPIPEGHHIDHLCRQTMCIRPEHLEAVLPRENVRRSRATKMTPNLVREIRASAESGHQIARRLGVTPQLVSMIRRRKIWKDV